MSLGESLARDRRGRTLIEVTKARYVEQEGTQALVQLDNADADQMLVPNASGEWPVPGDFVYLLQVADARFMLGAASMRANRGIVRGVTGQLANVEYPEDSGVRGTFAVPSGVTVQVGARVVIDHSAGDPVILAVYNPAPPEDDPEKPTPKPPAPPPAPKPKTATFNAAWSDTGNSSGWWNRNSNILYPAQRGGGSNFATFGYGDRVARTVGSRTVTKAEIYLGVARSTNLGLGWNTLTSASGAASSSGTQVVAVKNGWVNIPVSLAQALAGSGRALAFTDPQGTQNTLRGTGAGAQFGRLRITYS